MRKAGKLQTSEVLVVSRELALAADRSLWANEPNECIAIIARIYDLFDDLEHGLAPDARCLHFAAGTASWIGHMDRSTELLAQEYDQEMEQDLLNPGALRPERDGLVQVWRKPVMVTRHRAGKLASVEAVLWQRRE